MKNKKAPDTEDLYKEHEIRAKRAAEQKWKAYSHTTQEVEWSSHYGKWVVIITDIYQTDVLKEQGRKRQKKKKKNGGKKEKMQTMITAKQKNRNEQNGNRNRNGNGNGNENWNWNWNWNWNRIE